MKRSRLVYPFISLTIGALVASCGGSNVKESLGLQHDAPDEFRVLASPPLVIPPDFELRPPLADSHTLTAPTAPSIAKETHTHSLSTSEKALLQHVDTDKTDPQIRAILTKENPTSASDQSAFNILNPSTTEAPTESLVDPEGEKARLIKNKQEGKSMIEGETPTLTHTKSPLEKLLGK